MSSFRCNRVNRIPIKDESDLDTVKIGSLLEIERESYTHWAVYIGNRKVCHLTVQVSADNRGNNSFTQSMIAAASKKGQFIVQQFTEMMEEDAKVPVFVNNSSDSKWTPLPPTEIVQRAVSQVADNVAYDIVECNCEHFANECRYGKKTSLQVESTVNTVRENTAFVAGVASVAFAFGKIFLGFR